MFKYLSIFSFSFGVVAFQELADESSLNKVSFFLISYDYAFIMLHVNYCIGLVLVIILIKINVSYHSTFDAIKKDIC